MKTLSLWSALALLSATVSASISLVERPMMLYASVSPKLRIQTTEPAFSGILDKNVELKFTPSLRAEAYNLSIASDKVLTLTLLPGKKWANPSTVEGMTLYVTDIRIHGGENLLNDAVAVATVIPTPTIKRADDNIIYMSGTSKLVINGTNFREKGMDLVFEPPLENNKDYIFSVKSSTTMVLTRMSSSTWRSDPGPLKLRRIDTGAGALRVDPVYGGITVAEVQANLGMHGVTVESTPDERFYQNTGELVILGAGFNTTANYLRFANGIRGRGTNYTTVEHTKELLRMKLAEGSKWRANPENLPGPLVLLAVDAGAGFVAVGPTEAKKGRTVATIFETPSIVRNAKDIYQSHTHELWIKGQGFTRQTYTTSITFDPPLSTSGDDPNVNMVVYNRTHIKLTLLEGKRWMSSSSAQGSPLSVVSINTGAGAYKVNQVIATVKSDDAEHASGVAITRSNLVLYQTAALKKLVISGSGFSANTLVSFSPPLVKDVDYTQQFVSATSLTLTLRKHKKWRYAEGSLLVKQIDVGGKVGVVPIGSGGAGIQVAYILEDPQIEESERIMFASHSKRLVIRGTGFSLEGTELTLHPTPRTAYEIESLEMTEMILLLNEGQSWANDIEGGGFKHVFVTKIDTGAGEVILDDQGVIVAKVEPDGDDNACDDSCEWALDGVCDDGSGKGRYWWDDDYGGFYGYDDDAYGYGYYYDGDDDFLAPVCDAGTDCTDCGGPPTSEQKVECDNSCQWANDGFCDDTRTSGLCNLGTDCHDCGPVGANNFTTWDDDGWWDDDDNYWDIDDTFEYAARGESDNGDNGDPNGGSMFLTILEGMVYLVGAVICGGGTYLAVGFYKGQGDMIPYTLAPTQDPDIEMTGRAAVPITPDVTFTN
mmetsp:Transcript_20491/g.24263  ORF Transcript_20491/g.24263 Transcript_20491/m.24263 type:complete len:881 (+) Transcript_20491:59-2701(+)